MPYVVIEKFEDLQDDRRIYNPGDPFPADGRKVSVSRIRALSGTNNKRGIPLIREVDKDY